MAYTAVIPVRAGSTRVKDKNIRPFAGSSLLEVKIEQLKRISYIDQIVVSSDSEQMLELATCKGVMAMRKVNLLMRLSGILHRNKYLQRT